MPVDFSRRDRFAVDWDSYPETAEAYKRSISDEVDCICKSETFADHKLLKKLLRSIVTATLDGTPHRETTLGLEVWGKSLESWNPAEKNVVRTNVRRLREKLGHYYNHEQEDKYVLVRIDIPKGGYAAKITIFDPDRYPDIMLLPVDPVIEAVDVVILNGKVMTGKKYDKTYGPMFAPSLSTTSRRKKALRKKRTS